MFYRPGGKSTQHGGVEADVVIPSVLSGDDYGEKYQPFSIEGNQIQAVSQQLRDCESAFRIRGRL